MGGILMSVDTLLARCRDLGVTVTPGAEGKLRVSPPGVLPDALRTELKKHKEAVLILLAKRLRPHINQRGELIIPFACDPRYRWWTDGQSILETLREIGAPPAVVARYVKTDLSIEQ